MTNSVSGAPPAGDRRGIYVHVPFCVRKCFYCDFNSYALDRSAVETYLTSLEQEMLLHRRRLDRAGDHTLFDTLFIGGGTPTCLSAKDLTRLVRRIRDTFALRSDAEVTCEANPGSSNAEKFASMRAAGINRLSMGVQSLEDGLLGRLGRLHSAADAVQSFHAARRAGFDNINLDLMFALPGQSCKQWEETVREVLELGPEHLSCYSLIVEEGTPFGDTYARGKLSLPDQDTESDMYEWVIHALGTVGYEQYEISNFARPGRRSVHNQIYWRNDPYLAMGPGAHGYWESERYGNLRLPATYAAALADGGFPVDFSRAIGKDEQMDDTMIFGLRLLAGVSKQAFVERFGARIQDVYAKEVDRLVGLGLLAVTGETVRLTPRGLPLANQVFAAFLRD